MMLSMYAKIFTSLWDGSLRGKSDEILVFVNLLTHANPAGEVDRHFKAIADETGLPIERVRAAITALESDDPESRSPVEKGKRVTRLDDHRDWGWKIINYDHYRGLVSDHERREKTKERTRKWREKKEFRNGDAVVTLGDACDAKQKEKKKEKQKNKDQDQISDDDEVKRFRRPTEGQCEFYASKIGLPMSEVPRFIDYYESKGWKVGVSPMKSWEAAMRGWRTRWEQRRNSSAGPKTLEDIEFERVLRGV